MIAKTSVLSALFIIGIIPFLSLVHAEPSISIIMEKTTYQYCEKLFYIIEVSEITGNPAIIHIRDEIGGGSSAIPFPINELQNAVPAPFAFEREQFVPGKYFIDVEYNEITKTAEFNIIDSENICIPGSVKQFMIGWINGEISDGYLVDALQKNVDSKLINIPFEVNKENILKIIIPNWVKNAGVLWIEEMISDKDFAQMFNYLIDKKIVTHTEQVENRI